MDLPEQHREKKYCFCELCEKLITEEDMYLSCHICHKQFSCFFCGVAERQKYFNGIGSRVYNGVTYFIKCKRHYLIEDELCETDNCKICYIRNNLTAN